MECGQVLVELAAHALGGLEPAEARAVEDHLAGCPGCTAERARHAELTGLLERVRGWEVLPDAPVLGPGPERAITTLHDQDPSEQDGRD